MAGRGKKISYNRLTQGQKAHFGFDHKAHVIPIKWLAEGQRKRAGWGRKRNKY